MRLRKLSRWRLIEKDEAFKFSISGAFLFTFASLAMLFTLFANLALSCMFTISCAEMLPTLSFVGTLNYHDRLFVFACMAFFFIINFLNYAVLVAVHPKIDQGTRLMLLGVSFAASVFLVLLSIIDEINGIILHPLEGTHMFMSFSLLVFSLAWGYMVWREASLAKLYRLALAAKGLLATCGVLAFFTVYEWHFAYTVYANPLLSESIEALCEWSLVVTAALVPAVIAWALPELTVSVQFSNGPN